MDIPTPSPLTDSLRLLLETTLDAVVVMNADGRVAEWNERAVEMFGWTTAQTVGRNMADLIIPSRFREAHARGLDHFLQSGEGPLLGRRLEVSALRKSGEEFPVELTISPVREGGSFIFVGSLRDLTERKRAEAFRAQQALKAEVLYRIVAFAGESHSLEDALRLCLDSVHRLTQWPVGHVYLPTEGEPIVLMPSGIWLGAGGEKYQALRERTETTYLSPGEGLPGRVWQGGGPAWIADIRSALHFRRAEAAAASGIKSAFAFPIASERKIIAVIEFFTDIASEPDPDLLLTLRSVGDQVGRVFERRRAEQVLREQAQALELELAERKRGEEHQRLLLAELNHRVKNMLAVVTGIASQTARTSRSIAAFSENFLARLGSLSRAHTLLTAGNWEPTPLRRVAEEMLAPYAEPQEGRLTISGPAVALRPRTALAISMILHELVTNATKYGALARPEGRILVAWSIEPGTPDQLRLTWQETGVSGLVRPRRSGFGTRMIEASVGHELGGTVAAAYGPEGIRYDLVFPANQ